jgi:uncharacterized membrane protein
VKKVHLAIPERFKIMMPIGALLQAVAQLVDGGARWIVGPVGLVLVVVGAVLVFRLRRRAAVPR